MNDQTDPLLLIGLLLILLAAFSTVRRRHLNVADAIEIAQTCQLAGRADLMRASSRPTPHLPGAQPCSRPRPKPAADRQPHRT